MRVFHQFCTHSVMDAGNKAKSPTPTGGYAGRRRSIPIIKAEEITDHASRPYAGGGGRGSDAFQLSPPPPLHPPLHSDNTNGSKTASGDTVGVPSMAEGAPHALSLPTSATAATAASPSRGASIRLDEPASSPGSSSNNNISSATAAPGGGLALAHPLSPASDRMSLFCVPSYRATSASNQSAGSNQNTNPSSHTLLSPSNVSATPVSWRRALSPAASTGAMPGAPLGSVAAGGVGLGGSAVAAPASSTSMSSRQQRLPSMLYRQPSSAVLGTHGLSRGVNSSANAAAAAATASGPASMSAGNVYTLQLTEDDGGVEMAAARPLLREALRLRDVYKGCDKGQLELGGGPSSNAANNNNSSANPATPGSPLNSTLGFGAPTMNGLTALQQVDGVFYWSDEKTSMVPWVQFAADVMTVAMCVQHPACLAVARYRLQVLEEKYHLHCLYNADVEENGDRNRRGGGLYANACRVDNCVGAATAMNAHWLVEYIQQTVDAHGGDVVESAEAHAVAGDVSGGGGGGADGSGLGSLNGNGGGSSSVSRIGSVVGSGDAHTLERVCELLNFQDPYQLTVEGLGLQPSVQRALPYYDALDPALNGSGRNSAALLRLFLSIRSSAPQKGDYLAEAVLPSLTRNELRTSCPQATEMVLDITGVLAQEWEQTAAWVRTHELDSFRTNQFQIAFPITKWCNSSSSSSSGSGTSGGDGQLGTADKAPAYRGRSAAGGTQDGSEDGPRRVSLGGNENQGFFHNKLSLNSRGGTSSVTGRNYSAPDVTDAAVPLDAAPEDVLTYENYQQLLDHLFLPLFMATLAPEDPKFVDLASLLLHTGAIVLTGDETAKTSGGLGDGGDGGDGGAGVGGTNSNGGGADGGGRGREGSGASTHGSPLSDASDLMDADGRRHHHRRRRPADVPYTEPVSLTYMCYYIWANLCSLNALRRRRGMNALQLRVMASNATIPNTSSPHDASLLLLSYLIADVVVDAVALDKQPALQYLYGMNQVGVTMCPMARGSLGTTSLSAHPLAMLLWRGLRVSLCTISPLYYHASQDPLLEEYAAAAKCHRLSPTDLSELSLHSVCMSTFEDEVKASWVGAAFLREGWRGNAAELTSVPTARLQLRHDAWAVERRLLLVTTESPSLSPSLQPTTTAAGEGPESRTSKRSSTATRGREAAASAGTNRYGTTSSASTTTTTTATTTTTPPRRAGSAATTAATAAVQQSSPYTVLDPAVSFPRLFVMGPYDRDIANAHIAQSLHRALDLRHQYSALPLAQPSTLPPSEAAIEAVAGVDGNKADVRNSWLAALIHDPQAVLPHPTQSMSWAFKKAPLPPAAVVRPTSAAAAGAGAGAGSAAAIVVADAAVHPHLRFDEDEWQYKTVEGIIVPHEVHQIPRLPQDMYHYEDFCRHVQEVRHLIDHVRVREFARRRLQLLEHRFNLHAAVNHSLELGSTAGRASQNRDFYQSTKVDNNIRMETGMTARQLLTFIVDKATHNGDDIVSHPKGKEPQTLRQLLSELHISPGSLTVDDLNIQAGATSSNGGAPHNPFATEGTHDELLTLLLKTDNQMNGRYFAELTKRTFEELSRDQHTFTESRLSVYGASAGEWGLLSHWFDTHGMSSSHNQWVVQVPRIYSSLRKAGRVASFAEYLEHIFEPLWRISLHPNSDPRLFHFVNHIAAFDCVEDERRPDMPLQRATRAPHEWTSEEEPPYNYYLYHLYANLHSLNRFRQRRRFSVFAFRPSCGEAGSVDHLIGGFLLAQSISYGVRLADSAPLQYLFYLAQIGVTLSPLSNNTKLDLNYLNNPFPEFFRRGLRVSLGTDSPLLYHHTQEPLLEEYSIASKIWKLSANDLSEVARNSVLLSNFSLSFKEEKLGSLYFLSSSAGNDVTRTHLSDVRVAYRFETYHTEVGFLEYISGQHFHKALLTLGMEAQCKQLCGVADDAAAGEATAAEGKGERRSSPVSGRVSPSPRAKDILIDPTPKEADVKQLEQQRARMQRQLHELTTAVAELHKQNRLLTTKLGEEKERDQQAAQLRRHRVGDKLRELQGLLDQKQVRQPTSNTQLAWTESPTTRVEGRADTAGPGAAPRSASLLPFAPSPSTFDSNPNPHNNNNASQSLTSAGAAKSAPSTREGNGDAVHDSSGSGNKLAASADGPFVSSQLSSVSEGAAASAGSTPPAPALTSHDVFSTVKSRKSGQREETIAQTRQLLAHSEALWRSPSSSSATTTTTAAADAAATARTAPSGSTQQQESVLPPLDASPLSLLQRKQQKHWRPSPSLHN